MTLYIPWSVRNNPVSFAGYNFTLNPDMSWTCQETKEEFNNTIDLPCGQVQVYLDREYWEWEFSLYSEDDNDPVSCEKEYADKILDGLSWFLSNAETLEEETALVSMIKESSW